MSRDKIRASLLITFVLVMASCRETPGQTVGPQAVGLARWHVDDVAVLSDLLVQAGGATEVAFLPFEFTLDRPFRGDPWNDPAFVRARDLVTRTLPRIRGSLTLTTQLYFHNGPRDNYSGTGVYHPAFRWAAFQRRSNGTFVSTSGEDARFRDLYRERCLRTAYFLNALYLWAGNSGLAPKLGLVTVPDLEDNAPSLADYQNVQAFVVGTYAEVGASTQYRRSVDDGDTSRPRLVPLERHGDLPTIDRVARGDLYSNDGSSISIAVGFDNYLTTQRGALRRGVSVLFHREAYNGGLRDTPPFQRGTLRPLTNAEPGRAETAALRRVLQTR